MNLGALGAPYAEIMNMPHLWWFVRLPWWQIHAKAKELEESGEVYESAVKKFRHSKKVRLDSAVIVRYFVPLSSHISLKSKCGNPDIDDLHGSRYGWHISYHASRGAMPLAHAKSFRGVFNLWRNTNTSRLFQGESEGCKHPTFSHRLMSCTVCHGNSYRRVI